MRHAEFETLCSSLGSGTPLQLQHIVTHEVGRIVACQRNEEFFEVELASGEHKTWSKENVRLTH